VTFLVGFWRTRFALLITARLLPSLQVDNLVSAVIGASSSPPSTPSSPAS